MPRAEKATVECPLMEKTNYPKQLRQCDVAALRKKLPAENECFRSGSCQVRILFSNREIQEAARLR